MLEYSELYEILRKEKYGEVLQALPKSFVNEVSEFLKDLKDKSVGESDALMEEVGKSKKQFENSISIFKELILRRKRKILNLVFVATETGIMKRDYENMLIFEKSMFDKLVKSFEESDKDLENLLHEGDKDDRDVKNAMVIFEEEVGEFVDMDGNAIGPFKKGELVNMNKSVADVLVDGGKAKFVDE
jgi:DNA replication initiation complex subunit (GINS family)